MEKRVMHLNNVCNLLILLAAFLLIAPVSAFNEVLSDTRQQQLLHLLKQDCGSCHGMTLKGGLGPALLPQNLINKPTIFLKNTILFGRPGTAMPPWQGILTEQESRWLVKQLQQGIKNEE
jgi:cytochrome c55X